MLSNYLRFVLLLALMATGNANAGRSASANGEWIGVGVPTRINIGSPGYFYLAGNDHGACGATTPTYFRSDMSKPYFKEFYSLILLAQTQQRPLECIVESSCGAAEVWITYCTLVL